MTRSARRLLAAAAVAAIVTALPVTAFADGGGGGGGGGGGTNCTQPIQPLALSPADLSGNVGDPLNQFITAGGGCGTPFRFSIVSGSLPPGVRDGGTFGVQSFLLTGTPTTQGTFNFTVRVNDTTGHTATRSYSFVIGPPRPLQITNQGARDGVVGQSYQMNFFADGGVRPWTWSITGGTLPPGLRLSGNILSGTPTTAGAFTFTTRLTDSTGTFTERQFTVNIAPA